MKQFLISLALTCVLSVTAFGGDIPTLPASPPPPDGMTATSLGDIPTVGSAVMGDVPTVGSAVLNLLQTMFSLM